MWKAGPQTPAILETQVSHCYHLNVANDFCVIINELARFRGVSRWRLVVDIAASRTAATFTDPKAKGPQNKSEVAMFNADNYAGFATDIVYLSEVSMFPGATFSHCQMPAETGRSTWGSPQNFLIFYRVSSSLYVPCSPSINNPGANQDGLLNSSAFFAHCVAISTCSSV